MILFFSREQKEKNIHATPNTRISHSKKFYTHIYADEYYHDDDDTDDDQRQWRWQRRRRKGFIKVRHDFRETSPGTERGGAQESDPVSSSRSEGEISIWKNVRFSRRGEEDGDGFGGEEKSGERDRGESGDVEERFVSVRFGFFFLSIDRRECVLSSSSFFFLNLFEARAFFICFI
jgi:hypothetical protein